MAYTEAAILLVPSQYTYLPPITSSSTEKPIVVIDIFKPPFDTVVPVTNPPITVQDKISFQSPTATKPKYDGCADCNKQPIPFTTDFD